jgi:hypothetical protein
MSPAIRRVFRLVPRALLASAPVVLAACASVTPIGDLLSNASRYDGKTVRIAGTVENSAGLLGAGAYQVNDGTGTLTVISQVGTPPPKGEKIGVKGTFQALFTLLSKSLAVLKEQSRFKP